MDGTVTNRTTGKPQPGATVTLYKLAAETGLESVESVKSDANGKFVINQNLQGPRLLQSAYDGVTYNHMLPPGAPSNDVALDVYNASKKPGGATVSQHIVIFEPSGSEMGVSESFLWKNDGKTTFNDSDDGTLHFYAPAEAKGLQVNCTAPQGQPIRRKPEPVGKPGDYKLDFPIKPGETVIDITYKLPYTPPAAFTGKALYKGGPTSLIAPDGVTIKGEGLESKGQEPRSKATVYQTTAPVYKLEIEGAGALRNPESEQQPSGPDIQFVLPKLYTKLTWILSLAFSILALGFVLLYRAGRPAVKASGKKK